MGGSETFAPLLLELWEVGFQHHKAHQALQILPVTMAPKKRPTPTWVESTPAPPKAKVPKVTELNKLTSSESRGILFTVEGIDPKHFDTLVTKNFSSWEDVRTTLGVEPAVIVRLQDKLADRPEVKGWIEKPDDFPAESSQPDVAPPESTAKSAISKRHVAQGLTSELLEMHKDKRHATYEAMRSLIKGARVSRANTNTPSVRLPQFNAIKAVWRDMAA